MGSNLLSATITEPLGVKDRLGDLIAIRHPMFGNEDGSMNIGNDMAVNTAIIQMQGSVDELIQGAAKTAKKLQKRLPGKAGAYLFIHCGGRKLAIGDRIGEVSDAIKKVVGDTPFIMAFTFGEYGDTDHAGNTCGGLMLSDTAFCE